MYKYNFEGVYTEKPSKTEVKALQEAVCCQTEEKYWSWAFSPRVWIFALILREGRVLWTRE